MKQTAKMKKWREEMKSTTNVPNVLLSNVSKVLGYNCPKRDLIFYIFKRSVTFTSGNIRNPGWWECGMHLMSP